MTTNNPWIQPFTLVARNVVIAAGVIAILALVLGTALHEVFASLDVDEEMTQALAGILVGVLPVALFVTVGITLRQEAKRNVWRATAIAVAATTVVLIVVQWGQQTFNNDGTDSSMRPSLQFTAEQTDAGILVIALEAGGAAEQGGLLVGDVITAIRRDAVTLADLDKRVAEAADDTPFRLRLIRDGEETQLTVRTALVEADAQDIDVVGIATVWGIAVVASLIGLFGPAVLTPYILLALSLSPLVLGYLWLIIATFSSRTEGLVPVAADGSLGGLTLSNWDFLSGEGVAGGSIWTYTMNSLVIAVSMTVVSLLLCSMAGYALSRMEFHGRRFFLSMTLILHGFPGVTLLIPIYLVLLNLGRIPLLGDFIGYNTLGGIALIMVGLELPFGAWLMKGFFDNVSWDMERSALIDGATRWRTFWQIILPQIRPGMMALGIFAFLGGWNAYLIPAIFSIGTKAANLPVYIRQLTGEVNPVNWNQVAAVGIFQMIPILLLFIFAQEYLLNIYSGGTKGNS